MDYPEVINTKLVGSYPEQSYSGGGLVYDDVLEYRVWVKSNTSKGDNIWVRSYSSFDEANKYNNRIKNRKNIKYTHIVALVKQKKWYKLNDDGEYKHNENNYEIVKSNRITEWDINWLNNKVNIKKID